MSEFIQIINREMCKRFGLHHGQYFAEYKLKNQHWVLNGTWFGFGDLTPENIAHIQSQLVAGEVFEGYWEHHDTDVFPRRTNPMVIIRSSSIIFPASNAR